MCSNFGKKHFQHRWVEVEGRGRVKSPTLYRVGGEV